LAVGNAQLAKKQTANFKVGVPWRAGLCAHTTQALGTRPVSAPIPNAKLHSPRDKRKVRKPFRNLRTYNFLD